MRNCLIRRSSVFNFLPQEPAWFCNVGHHRARARYKRKLRSEYKLETLSSCPSCGENEMSLIATQERHGLPVSVVVCERCALIFNNPRPDAAAFRDHYARDYREIERGVVADIHEFMFTLQENKAPDIWAFIKAHAEMAPCSGDLRIAEIGCGEGGTISWLARNVPNVKVTGFELNEDAVSYGKSLGLDLRSVPFGSGDAFDIVILEQVLEHLSDVSGFLDIISRSQKAGDLLYVGVPGIFNAGEHYQSNFIGYLEYGHLSHFCLRTLERVLAPHGYRLLYGEEKIRALFVRARAPLPILLSKSVSARQVKDYLLEMEDRFNSGKNQLLRNWRAYAKYLVTYLCS